MTEGTQKQSGFAEVNGARLYYEDAGAGRPLVMLHIAGQVAAQIPRARKIVIDDAGHHPNMEHPLEFNQIVLEFLGGLASDGE